MYLIVAVVGALALVWLPLTILYFTVGIPFWAYIVLDVVGSFAVGIYVGERYG